MNLDNLQLYLENKRVYSNDLNIILKKTPPRVFRFVLIALAVGVAMLVFFAWFVTYSESFTTNAIYKTDQRSLYFVSEDKKVEQLSALKKPEVYFSSNSAQQKRQLIIVDSVRVQKVYEVNGVIYNDVAALQNAGVSFDRVIQKYAVDCYIAPASAANVSAIGADNLAQLSFTLSKKKMISKYVKFF